MRIITKQLQPQRWIRSGVLLFLLASLLPVALIGSGSSARRQLATSTLKPAELPVTSHGADAIAQLKQQGNYDSLAAALRRARYSVSRADSTPLGRAAWHAPNSANGYDGYVTEDGVSISLSGAGSKSSYVSLTLRGIGYGDGLQYVGGGEVSGDQQKIRIERNGQFKALKEWYVNSESGLEQGFTLTEPPGGRQGGGLKLRLAFTVGEGWHAVASADGQHITLLGEAENEAVNYGKLVIWDANGSPISGALLVEDERVIIEVDDGNAAYPLTIDPIFALQQKLVAADGAAGDFFGVSVAIHGETAVIGARGDNVGANADQGSAYVFVRSGATWTQQAKLTAADGAANDRFGVSVGISGETVVVGAYLDDISLQDEGSAYVFVRSGTTWAQQQKLNGTHTQDDFFGFSVAISGETVVVGRYGKNVFNGTDFIVDQGDAFVFTRSGTFWTEQQILKAADGATGDQFGYSVALSGDTVVIGAYFDDVGGNADQGSAYVFTRSGSVWTQQRQLTAADGAAGDKFGVSIAISGETVMVGAYSDDVGANADRGSLSVFTQAGPPAVAQAKLTAADGAMSDNFGYSVAISGDTAVIGVVGDDVSFANQGSAYVFVRSGTVWAFQQKLTAADGGDGDAFGASVAISGETVVVGAYGDDTGQGSAYVFVPCRFDLSPASANIPVGGGGGSFMVNCPNNCAWTAAALPAWLTITSSASGTGNGTITFSAAANPGFPRTSSISVSGSSFVVTQDGACAPTINPAALPGGITNTPYNQTLTASGGSGSYNWQRANGTTLPPGLSLSAGGVISGTPPAGTQGNYTFTVAAVDTNGCGGSRMYTMNIATCAVISLTPTSQAIAGAGGSFNFTVTAPGCAWTTLSNAPWLTATVNPTGTGNLVVGYSVGANSGPARPGLITVNNQVFTVTQAAACAAVQVNPASLPNGTVGTAYNQTLTATGGTPAYTFSMSVGSLPGGLNLAVGGALTGTPNAAGVFNFTIKATDANGCMGTLGYTMTINGGAVNNGLQFYPLAHPVRLLDTRPGQVGCDAPGAPITSHTSRNQTAAGRTCDGLLIPANAKALTGNITTVQSGGGYLTLYPSEAAQPLVANSNYNPNEILNNVFTVGLGAGDGAFKIFVTSDTHLVVDVTGYYAPPGAGGLFFHPLPQPIRLLETRAGFTGCHTPGLPIQGGVDTAQQGRLTCAGVTIPASAQALAGNATVVNAGGGYLTFWPSGTPRPLVANSNYTPGQVLNAPFTVGLGADGNFMIYATATTDLVVDVLGYYSAEANDQNGTGLLFNPLPQPVRLLETRASFTGCYTPNAPLLAGSTRQQQARGACGGASIAASALAIVGNATVVNNQAGYLTFWPNGAAQPLVATSNFTTGQVLNRHFTVGLGATGMFNIFTTAQTDLVIDVSGFFAP